LEKPQDDANRNQADKATITQLLDQPDQITNDVTSDEADHAAEQYLKQYTDCDKKQPDFNNLAEPHFDCT
jgi:hypothetical protein